MGLPVGLNAMTCANSSTKHPFFAFKRYSVQFNRNPYTAGLWLNPWGRCVYLLWNRIHLTGLLWEINHGRWFRFFRTKQGCETANNSITSPALWLIWCERGTHVSLASVRRWEARSLVLRLVSSASSGTNSSRKSRDGPNLLSRRFLCALSLSLDLALVIFLPRWEKWRRRAGADLYQNRWRCSACK